MEAKALPPCLGAFERARAGDTQTPGPPTGILRRGCRGGTRGPFTALREVSIPNDYILHTPTACRRHVRGDRSLLLLDVVEETEAKRAYAL